MGKSLKETIRERVKSGVPIEKSAPNDPFYIGDEDTPQEENMLGEMTTSSDEVSFSDFEKDGQASKLEPEQKETTKGVTEGTEKEAPPPAPAETETEQKGTGTDNLAVGSDEELGTPAATPATPPAATSAGKIRVSTVEGDEEVTLEDLKAGYMMKKHYTQTMQFTRERERRISDMLANPELLVKYAVENGVDLKPLVHAAPEVQEIKIPELSEYATDEQRAAHQLLSQLAQQNNFLMKKVGMIESSTSKASADSRWNDTVKVFDEIRGDIPKDADFAFSLFMREGRRQFGEKYTHAQAVKDFRKAEGDIFQRAMNSSKGKEWLSKHDVEVINNYRKTKDQHEKESVSADILPPAKAFPVTGDEKPRFKNAHEGAEAAKKRFGIF